MKKRILALLLVLALAVSLTVIPASAEKTDGTKYPTVFVHGLFGFGYNDRISELLPYWGGSAGSMIEYLNGLGYDAVEASIGPMSSAWDRCCELFAQLTGTVTDYGAAHSSKVAADYANASNDLKHDRFGRDYTGGAIVDNWGPVYENGKVVGWYDNKLNLVGHSFGGPTSTMFLELLAEGNEAERAWAKEEAAVKGGDWHDYCSPLFWGDYNGQYLINSLTSLAGVLNGTTFLSVCKDAGEIVTGLAGMMANTLGLTEFAGLYDFQLEEFGISKVPGKELTDEEFVSSKKVAAFLDGYDNALYDLSIQGCNELKQGWDTFDNVYYFAYAGNRTHKNLFGNYVPDADMCLLMLPYAIDMGGYDYNYEQVKDIHGNYCTSTDAAWKPNDGLVNTISARYPLGAAQKPLDPQNIEPGVWQWTDIRFDHLTFCGLLQLDLNPSAVTKPFYEELMENISGTAPVYDPDGELFNDISRSGYHDAITEAAKLGIVTGYADGSFRPNASVTRAQFITMLWRVAGQPLADTELSFTDSAEIAAPFADAVKWGVAEGVIQGYTDGSFQPNQSISRAQMATFMYRYLLSVGYDFGEVPAVSFKDAGDINAAYADAVAAIVSAGIMNGMSADIFAPNATANRGMAATVMLRLYKLG